MDSALHISFIPKINHQKYENLLERICREYQINFTKNIFEPEFEQPQLHLQFQHPNCFLLNIGEWRFTHWIPLDYGGLIPVD